jgi:TRAP-type C4-dicarboxylate transport system substrate-binding protein
MFTKEEHMKKLLLALLVIAVLITPVFAQGTKEAKDDDYHLVLRMSHVFAPNEQLTKSLEIVRDRIYERTNGAIDVQHYWQSQLAVYKDGVEQVARGANFISVEDPSYLGDYIADFNALVGPMLYNSFEEYQYMIQTPLVQGWLKELEEKHRIKVLALDYIFGFRNLKTNKVIVTPADLKGLKIRVPGSQLFIDTLNAMGAVSTPIGFAETLSAVQQGVVDGLEGTMDAYGSNGSSEVAKNMALTQHFLGTCGVYINVDVFNKIPAEYQKIIQEEFTAGALHMNTEISNNYESTKARLESQGHKFNEVDSEAFAKTVESVYTNMKGVTPGIYNILKGELAKMPK